MNDTIQREDQLGQTSSALNSSIIDHLTSDVSTGTTVDRIFSNYTKQYPEEEPLGTHEYSELSSTYRTPEDIQQMKNYEEEKTQGRREIIGNNKVLVVGEDEERASLNGTILIFIVVLLTLFVYLIYFSNYIVRRNGTFGGGNLFDF